MKPVNIFDGMSLLNRWALSLFIVAKLCGAAGVVLGFVGPEYHRMGGWLLGFAMSSIFLSVALCIRQSALDRVKFSREDEEASKMQDLRARRRALEREIMMLEEKRSAAERFALTRLK